MSKQKPFQDCGWHLYSLALRYIYWLLHIFSKEHMLSQCSLGVGNSAVLPLCFCCVSFWPKLSVERLQQVLGLRSLGLICEGPFWHWLMAWLRVTALISSGPPLADFVDYAWPSWERCFPEIAMAQHPCG